MTTCAPIVEPCHADICDAVAEVQELLPHGPLWDMGSGSTAAGYFMALAEIKAHINALICQELKEVLPCESQRLFPYWAELYKLPECVDQTTEKLCEWLDIIYDPSCPIGSLGFIRKAIEFVNPDIVVTLHANPPDVFGACWCGDRACAEVNNIIIEAPPDNFYYETYEGDYPHEVQDGIDPCKRYYLPEVECLRDCVFPYGLSVGYKTTGATLYDIEGVPEENERDNTRTVIQCNKKCEA